VAWLFLIYIIGVVRLTASVPGASLPVQTGDWMI
jgi:hypothetical protein